MDSLNESLRVLLERAKDPLPERYLEEIVIYGAGNCGRRLSLLAKERGIRVVAFLDARAALLQSIAGIPCYHPQSSEVIRLANKGIPVVIAVYNYAADPGAIIDLLHGACFQSIISYFEIHERFVMDPEFWLTSRMQLYMQREKILKGLDLFHDPVSRQVYHDHIALRMTFDQTLLRSPSVETQYAPLDLPSPRSPMRLVDGGAFVGDTVNFFLDRGVEMEALAAFEPDLNNYVKLVENSERYTALNVATQLYPCGLGSETKMFRFQGKGGEGSLLTEAGDLHVQVLALDDVLPNFRPTLIKLDVEGAESAALLGSAKTIRKYVPDLAVCVYHAMGDLWEIPGQIHEMLPDSKLSLRYHRFNGLEIVTYATSA